MWPELGSDFLFTGGGYEDAPDPALPYRGDALCLRASNRGLTLRWAQRWACPMWEKRWRKTRPACPWVRHLEPDRRPRGTWSPRGGGSGDAGHHPGDCRKEQKLSVPDRTNCKDLGVAWMPTEINWRWGVGDENWMGSVHLFEKDANGSWQGVTEIQPQTRTNLVISDGRSPMRVGPVGRGAQFYECRRHSRASPCVRTGRGV